MQSLTRIVSALWGRRAEELALQYRRALDLNPLIEADLAIFCNAAAPIVAATDFERGVEEGKRRVWLHIARIRRLDARDFVPVADGDRVER